MQFSWEILLHILAKREFLCDEMNSVPPLWRRKKGALNEKSINFMQRHSQASKFEDKYTFWRAVPGDANQSLLMKQDSRIAFAMTQQQSAQYRGSSEAIWEDDTAVAEPIERGRRAP